MNLFLLLIEMVRVAMVKLFSMCMMLFSNLDADSVEDEVSYQSYDDNVAGDDVGNDSGNANDNE